MTFYLDNLVSFFDKVGLQRNSLLLESLDHYLRSSLEELNLQNLIQLKQELDNDLVSISLPGFTSETLSKFLFPEEYIGQEVIPRTKILNDSSRLAFGKNSISERLGIGVSFLCDKMYKTQAPNLLTIVNKSKAAKKAESKQNLRNIRR